MKYRLLGRTGLYVSDICLGTMNLGGQGIWQAMGALGQSEATAQLKSAFEAGVNFYDTANIYAFGESETLFGQAIRESGIDREELVIATKVRGRMKDGANNVGLSRKHILAQLDQSLKRLNVEYIDLYQIHGFDPVTPMDETLSALNDAVRAGKVRYLGVSNHTAWQIMKAQGISERQNWSRFESIQAYYSIAGRELEREIVPMAQDQQMGIMVWSPLAGGYLSGKFDRDGKGPDGSRRSSFDFPPVNKDKAQDIIGVMREIGGNHDASVAQIALSWVLHQPGISSIIIGARTEEQLAQNLVVSEIVLSADELVALDKISQLAPEYPHWMLGMQSMDRYPDGASLVERFKQFAKDN
ncbi:MAG: aldo/keto reductase [Candidatus Sericytochromatia bacterium]|nr:aldo/keto reductase [Candidatus Sericytochromatia bacterium]